MGKEKKKFFNFSVEETQEVLKVIQPIFHEFSISLFDANLRVLKARLRTTIRSFGFQYSKNVSETVLAFLFRIICEALKCASHFLYCFKPHRPIYINALLYKFTQFGVLYISNIGPASHNVKNDPS